MQADPYSLDRLHDIVPGEPVSWWPPAPFWYCVMSLALVWALYAIVKSCVNWFQNAYRRQAIRELEIVANCPRVDDQDSGAAVMELSRLLKRVAIVAFTRERVAALSGDRWLAFLDATCDGADFSRGPAKALGAISYDPACASVGRAEVDQIIASARQWILGHRAEGTK